MERQAVAAAAVDIGEAVEIEQRIAGAGLGDGDRMTADLERADHCAAPAIVGIAQRRKIALEQVGGIAAQRRRHLGREQPHALARQPVLHVAEVKLDEKIADLRLLDQLP